MKAVKKTVILKKRIIEVDSDKINEDILYLINEARTSPQYFLDLININDTNDKELQDLLNFFNYSSYEVPPLISEPNLSICSKDLLDHIISEENNKEEEEKDIKDLKGRLIKLNLIPINYRNFIILDAIDPIEAIINLFLNNEYRMNILSPEIKYIGIASGLYHTGNLCIVIDIVQSLKSINYNNDESRYKNIIIEENDYNHHRPYKLKRNYSDKKFINKKSIFANKFNIPKNNYENLEYKDFNKDIFKINRDLLYGYIEYKYKYPINVQIKKDYIKDECGNIRKIYIRESNYDDGSVLIQPDIDFIY